MKQYEGDSADEVWRKAACELINCPEYTIASRGGNTIESLQCSLSILDPRRRWILSRSPAYNPAFGLVELIWMFNGKDDSEVLKFWNENDIFNKSVNKEAPNGDYIFYDGPPFATGTPHYGHLLQP